ncbi:hypothetical protein SNOG_14151 [Parastagonospora nodorum SN15]|uniref:EF-hand domain-containing protein n=1 Tax=Phaeosphaeria nodorum (strain SN15 / ATCC MYA-4574 / FGSC 10173) TaxID=321614 RepID=Q0U1X9_PHANO|nr:hypothetical protein SNOG_14151 [Parastagonospora nodorum SN15]EAT78388.1 hypothetical protein SNOG_14151 [Parastagonospora nodorum SN15]
MRLIVFFGVVTSLLPSVIAVCCKQAVTTADATPFLNGLPTQILTWVWTKETQMWVEWFKSHDTNNDGVITVDEAAKQ